MIAYLIRRLLYVVPIVLGVLVITFVLFFIANSPQEMARRILGDKAPPESVQKWVQEKGYDLPRFYNAEKEGTERFTATLFYTKCARVLMFKLGRSDATGRYIWPEIRRRMIPSLAIALPSFVLGMAVNITLALIIAFCRGTYLDRWGTVICVLLMSISTLFYIIGGQLIFAKWLRLFPISGFDWGTGTLKFVFLPVLIGVIGGIGRGVRYNRTVMLEEVSRDYVRTARAKGLGEAVVMFRHVLKNAMIPILTGAVMVIPFLFMGSLIMESFFSIPGLGSMTMTAIDAQDYAVIRSMTFIGAILYIVGLVLTDISYTLVDPRIRLGAAGKRSLYGRPSLRDVVKIVVGLAVLGGTATGMYYGFKALAKIKIRVPIVTNGVLAIVLVGFGAFLYHARKSEMWVRAWYQIRKNRLAMISLVVMSVYVVVGIMDSISWSNIERKAEPGKSRVLAQPETALDRILKPLSEKTEKSYSSPLARNLLAKDLIETEVDGKIVVRRDYPKLNHPGSHVLGTDKTGQDVLFITFKSVRTGLIVGGLTTLIAVPFAIFFGVLAGFFGGWIDDIVQYVYTTLASIPWILLVVCFMMVFKEGLIQVCIVMGITGWVGLCRVLRGETLKLREREYVQAALALGVSKFRVLVKHIVPNVMHLVLINVVLRFSGLVLAEAVLSYIGIGVGSDTYSWGNMIDGARGELGRDPVVWWGLVAAFVAMFMLVLPANLFGDAMRDALDPRLRVRGEGQ